ELPMRDLAMGRSHAGGDRVKTYRSALRTLMVLLLVVVTENSAFSIGVYHEAGCPSVDTKRMPRMKRGAAEAMGLLPAPDCPPGVRVRYLGVSGASGPSS